MFTWNCKGKLIVVEKPLIMGILNINDDSFYAGSRFNDLETIATKAEQMISEGADILDIGGQSTRPESTRISAEEELQRVLPVIEMLAKRSPQVLLSIDTYHSNVALTAVQAGASLVNDISAGEIDKQMLITVGQLNVPYICMHMKGVPETMHLTIGYDDVTKEVFDFFVKKSFECKQAGINDFVIDPGFGFGKNIHHNLKLLKDLSIFKTLGKPVIAGLSRKSSIYKTLHITAEEALNGTTVLNTLALQNGADILRVHDVKEAVEAMTLLQAYDKA